MPFSRLPIAVITGGASGIGLALTKRLAARGYRIFVADVSAKGEQILKGIHSSSIDASDLQFVKTDVSSWESQQTLLQKVTNQAGQIDVFVANAGIADTEDFFASSDKKLSTNTLDVDLNGVLYGLKLFMQHTRKARIEDDYKQTKFIVTSSMMGIYPFSTNPVYSAAKHAVIGLVRSIGPRLLDEDNIAVNAILPGFIDTGLGAPGLVEAIRQAGHLTPMDTMLKAYDMLLEADDLAGQTLEVSGNKIYNRSPVEFCDDTARWLVEDPDRVWDKAYRELWRKS